MAWINVAVLVAASLGFLYCYVRSVSPAGQAMVSGPGAFERCFRYRLASGVFEFIIMADYVLYLFFPITCLPLPAHFPWPWWLSIAIGLAIGVPATVLMMRGARDAGEETLRPKQEHTMYGGIYTRLRHPQAVGEVFLFAVTGLLLHSPFLTLWSLVYFPIFVLLCYAEEQDLLLRYGEAYADYCRRTGAFWPRRAR
jgi:protein-S-isoprenylcysteine O-methyltransferase Ste14